MVIDQQVSWPFASSSSDRTYEVILRADGRLSCDCPGWTVKRNGKPRSCKHTKAVVANFDAVEQRDDGEYVVEGNIGKMVPATLRVSPPVTKPATGSEPRYRDLMLADKMPEGQTIDDFPASEWQMEQKFDGERCLVAIRKGRVWAWSRKRVGKTEGISRDLGSKINATLAAMPDGDYDCELVVAGGMSSDVKRLTNAQARTLVIFDILQQGAYDLTGERYDFRRAALGLAFAKANIGSGPVIMSTAGDPDADMLAAIWQNGGEGVILKRIASPYVGRRSTDWIKIKQHDELVATVTGFEDSKINGSKNAVVLFRLDSGVMSKAKVRDASWHRRIEKGEITIGTRIEIAYQSLMPSGSPRHPMAKRVVGDA